jgi:hypothetical protein
VRIEVDQSGKIGSGGPTVLALSNEIDYKILIPGSVKRECVEALRLRGKTGSTLYLQLFSVALFLLLKHHFAQTTMVVIDQEYTGRSKDIKGFLVNLLIREGLEVDADSIWFERIGKQSNAHKKALATLRGKLTPDRVINTEEILDQLIGSRG